MWLGKLKSPSASKTWNFQPIVTEINKKVQRDGQEICFWWKKSCFGGQQLPCPSSQSELKIDQVAFPPTKHKFSDVANGHVWFAHWKQSIITMFK